jgi:hypothetical protein
MNARWNARSLAALLSSTTLFAQGVRVTGVATPGGSVQVDVGGAATEVSVGVAGSGQATRHDVPPGKSVTVPIPTVPPGTVLVVWIGRRMQLHRVLVEVVAP